MGNFLYFFAENFQKEILIDAKYHLQVTVKGIRNAVYSAVLTRIPHALLMRQYGFLILDMVDADIHGPLVIAVVIGAIRKDIGSIDNSAIGINAAFMRRVLLAHMQHHDVSNLHVTGRRERLHMPRSFDLVEQVPLAEIDGFNIKCHFGTSDASVVFEYPLHILSGNAQRVVGEFLIENISFREVHEEAIPVFGIIGVFKEHLHDFLCSEMLFGVFLFYCCS